MDSLEPSFRQAAKVVLIDGDGEVLLFRGGDPARPDAGTWWFTPGGGLEGDESFVVAARREVWEETGLWLGKLGPIVSRRDVEFSFLDKLIRADEAYFVVRVDRFEPSTDGWTQNERDSMVEYRWWTLDELRITTETVYPDGLLALIEHWILSP